MVVSIADLAVNQRLAERKFEVTRTDVIKYAAASGDFNPLHHDDAAARAAGMPGAIAHGMFSAGCLATALTDAVGVDALTQLAVRFRAQAPLGITLTSHIVVSGTRYNSENTIVDLDCQLMADDAIVVSGVASVATPPRTQEMHEIEGSVVAPESSASTLVGTRLTPATVIIERGPVQFFATAVGDDSPVYRSPEAAAASGLDGIPVPPTYIFAAAHWGTFADRQPSTSQDSVSLVELIALLRDGRKGAILHGEQEFCYHAPLRVGNTLYAEGCVEAVEHKPGTENRPGMTVMVVRTDYRNAPGQLLTTARSTYLFRPAARE